MICLASRRWISFSAYDVTVSSPFRAAVRSRASKLAGAAAALAERPKFAKYQDLLRSESMDFCPIGIDCLGAFGPGAKKAILQIGGYAARQKGTSASVETQSLTAQLVARLYRLQALAISQRRERVFSNVMASE